MKRYLLITTLVVLTGAAIGLAAIPTRSGVAEQLTPAAAQADFDLMRKALEEAHSGLYRYSTKAEMDRLFDMERAKLNRSVTKTEFLVVVAETLAGDDLNQKQK